jgi:SAM-dependent methyltransferase
LVLILEDACHILAGVRPDESAICRVCGGGTAIKVLEVVSNGYRLGSCDACGTVLAIDEPDWTDVRSAYDRLYSAGESDAYDSVVEFQRLSEGARYRSFYRGILLRAAERATRGRRLFEVGSGAGGFGSYARSRGWSYVGVDVSAAAAAYARRLGLAVARVEPNDPVALLPQSVDLVVLWEVIEHIWDVDGWLNEISRALRPRGVVVLSTPNLAKSGYWTTIKEGSPKSSPPIHLNFFSATSLRSTLEAHELKPLRLFQRRLRRPGASLSSVRLAVRTLIGWEPGGTLFALAQKDGRTTPARAVAVE